MRSDSPRPFQPIFDIDLKYGDQTSPTAVIGGEPVTGGTITILGDYIYHTFTTDGTFNAGATGKTCDYLVIGGGGSGGGFRAFINENSGGGGGQCRHADGVLIIGAVPITIGLGGLYLGGSNPAVGSPGGDTVFGSIATAPGGRPGGDAGAPRTGGASGNELGVQSGGTGVAGGDGSGGGAGVGGDTDGDTHTFGSVLHGGEGSLSNAGCGFDWKLLGVWYGGGGNGVTNSGNHGPGTEGRNNNPNNPSGQNGWGQGGHQVGNGGSGIVIVRYPRF